MKHPFRAFLSLIVLAFVATSWRAEAAEQPDCYAMALRIGGAGFQIKETHQGMMIDRAEFQAAFGAEVQLKCDNNFGVDVSLSYDGRAMPSPVQLSQAIILGEMVTGAPRAEVDGAVRACLKKALAPNSGEMGDVLTAHLKVDCQAFARDGGAGYIDMYVPTPIERCAYEDGPACAHPKESKQP